MGLLEWKERMVATRVKAAPRLFDNVLVRTRL